MKRLFGAMLGVLVLATASQAHFVYIVPNGTTGSAKVIFSDSLKPDERVNIEKIAATKLVIATPNAKPKPIEWKLEKAGSHYTVEVPGEGPRVVGGHTDYGVLQRGEAPAFWLRYYSKAVIGGPTVGDQPLLGADVPLEIVTKLQGGKLVFQAFLQGKPLPKAEFDIMIPGEEEAKHVVADDEGVTPAFEKPGTYAARVKFEAKTAGTHQAKKYESIRHFSTLVLEWK